MTPERGEVKSRPMLGSCSIKGNSPFKKIYAPGTPKCPRNQCAPELDARAADAYDCAPQRIRSSAG